MLLYQRKMIQVKVRVIGANPCLPHIITMAQFAAQNFVF
jgi:hypothetical protein